MKLNEVNDFWLFLGGILSAIGGAYIWIKTTKSKILSDVSENKKSVKLNDVEGNKAMVEQIDYLLNQITLMSDSMLKDKIELSQTKTKEIKYIEKESRFQEAIKLIKLSCENCKISTEKILNDFKL